jgi:hypothetical protein
MQGGAGVTSRRLEQSSLIRAIWLQPQEQTRLEGSITRSTRGR